MKSVLSSTFKIKSWMRCMVVFKIWNLRTLTNQWKEYVLNMRNFQKSFNFLCFFHSSPHSHPFFSISIAYHFLFIFLSLPNLLVFPLYYLSAFVSIFSHRFICFSLLHNYSCINTFPLSYIVLFLFVFLTLSSYSFIDSSLIFKYFCFNLLLPTFSKFFLLIFLLFYILFLF